MKTKAQFSIGRCSEAEALEHLVVAAARIVRNARWCNLTRSKVNELRKPLLQLRAARRHISKNLIEQ